MRDFDDFYAKWKKANPFVTDEKASLALAKRDFEKSDGDWQAFVRMRKN